MSPSAALPAIAFALAACLGSALLFALQPMLGKALLPRLGGVPAVWTTCMLFFQAMLLAGYGFAHLGRRLTPRRQAGLQVALLLGATLLLPPVLPGSAPPPADDGAALWTLGMLLAAAAVPVFVLTAQMPVLQRWYAARGAAMDPYILYAASNLGSLAALLAYPSLLEPLLGLDRQMWLWSGGYAALALLLAALLLLDRTPASTAVKAPAATVPTGWGRRLRWLALAALPASLLLGVTQELTADLAAVPLFWVVPLTLYLLSWVVAFAHRAGPLHRLAVWGQPLVLLPLAAAMLWGSSQGLGLLLLHLAAFWATAQVCHGELARSAPAAEAASGFYVWIAAGGLLGGAFNAVAAPLLFTGLAEYPLALGLACMLRPQGDRAPGSSEPLALSLLRLGMVGGAALGLVLLRPEFGFAITLAVSGMLLLLCYSLLDRPPLFGLAVASLLLAGYANDGSLRLLHAERSYFGTIQLRGDNDGFVALISGGTVHGGQYQDAERRLRPGTYYRPGGPPDRLIRDLRQGPGLRRVAVAGLGTGSLACLGAAGEEWSFMEIDPNMARLATDPDWFTWLRDCPPRSEVVLGDARLALAEPGPRFSAIVLDAFTSRAVPVHLMTREALEIYLARLEPHGPLLANVTNRHVDFRPVLANLADEMGLEAWHAADTPPREAWLYATEWIALARPGTEAAAILADDGGWQPLKPDRRLATWTDNHSDMLSVLRPFYRAPAE